MTASILPAPDAPDVWWLSPETRLRKQLANLGINTAEDKDSVRLLLRGDVIYDDAVLSGIMMTPDALLIDEDGRALAAHVTDEKRVQAGEWLAGDGEAPHGLKMLDPATAGSTYDHNLRKRAVPKCYVVTSDRTGSIERDLYDSSYKGVTDIVTKYLWPLPAYYATRLCARLRLTPNTVTLSGIVLMFAALWLFWQGHYGWGLLAGWIMTFLDTVDGKLARVTLTASKWGNVLDHGLDLLHPPFWYIAWGIGLEKYGVSLAAGWLSPVLWSMFVFYVLGRVAEGYFMRRFGMHLHVWRRFDSRFRLILARRNPNLIVLTLSWLFGRPDIGLLIVTAWHGITFAVHCVQIAQAERQRRNGAVLTSWLNA